MTVITTTPIRQPEPEITIGPWDIADWSVKNFGPPWDPRERMGVAVTAVHRATGEEKRQAVRIVLNERSGDDAEVLARVIQAKDLLRTWVGDLNAAEREGQPA